MTVTQRVEAVRPRAVELTKRSIATGIVIGAALTPCNVYSGLKIGWSFNMSIAAGLIGAGFWRAMAAATPARPMGLLENNINQTTASSSASIISGGLVAPIPALTLLTGQSLDYGVLAFWVFAVSILGVVVAGSLRHQMVMEEKLPFPAGLATAETMTQIHASGSESSRRLRVLLTGGIVSAAVKLSLEVTGAVTRWAPTATLKNLTISLDPSLLMIGFGAIIGLRVGVSLLLGCAIAWGVLAPLTLELGWAQAGPADAVWFEELVSWLLWPGVTLIVVSALVSFAISLSRLQGGLHLGRMLQGVLSPRQFLLATAASTALVVTATFALFGIGLLDAVLAVVLSFVLAVVAARVTGETGVTPIGALGKITQLTYGVVTPGDVTSNLMTANVTGGAAGQCADLMHDLKTGAVIGATPQSQLWAQVFGVLVGSLVGTLVYLLLIPDPSSMLLTPEWPAPAVATWKAVAEVLSKGLSEIPQGAGWAMLVASLIGLAMAIAERNMPPNMAAYFPSAPAIGLAFVIPAWNSLSLFLGAALAALLARFMPAWARRNTLALAAGLVAGESLAGVGLAIYAFGT